MCVGELRAAPSIGIKPVPSWVVPVTPGGKAPSAKDFSEGYYLPLVDKQVNLGTRSTYHRFVRQIASESGIQNGSEVSVTFDPAYERVDFHEVTIWRNGQRISQLNLRDFKVIPVESERQRFIYNGFYSASLVLKDIRKGDRIDVAYSTTGWNPVFEGKYSSLMYFHAYDYIGHIHTSILAPAGRVLYFKDFNKPPVRNTRNVGGNVLYEWEVRNVKDISYDDYVPGWYAKEPFVQVTEFKTWKEVVDWGLNFYKVPAPAGALKARVDEWKSQSQSTLEFIGKAVRFVQDEIRYLGIETGENSHKPHRPEDVFAQRYGDCKDKAFLLCAILRSNGIECDPVLVDTYKRSHLTEFLPSPSDFNHVIARVRVEEKNSAADKESSYAFIDATMALQGGAVPQMYCPPYGKGLILAGGQSKPINIPNRNDGQIEITEDIYLPKTDDSSAVGSIMVKTGYYKGEADYFRNQFQEGDQTELEENYLNFYKDLFKHADVETSDTLEYYDQREGNSFSLVERYSLKNPWRLDSTTSRIYFDVFGKTLYTTLTLLPGRPRKDPVSLKFPSDQHYTINIHMPGEWPIGAEKWEIKRDAYIISFESKYITEEYTWQLRYHFKTLKDHVSAAEAKQYKADIDKLVENLEYQLTDPREDWLNFKDLNILMLALLAAATFFASRFFRRLYRYSPGLRHYHEPGIHLGSWLVFLAFAMVSQPISLTVELFNQLPVYLSSPSWDAMEAKGVLHSTAYRGLLMVEMVFNVGMIGYAVLVAFLFFKKRDSFPQLYIYFMGISLLGGIVDAFVTYAFFGDLVNRAVAETSAAIGRTMLFSAIWIPYLIKSSRVKRTFVNTYGEKPAVEELSEGAKVAEPLE